MALIKPVFVFISSHPLIYLLLTFLVSHLASRLTLSSVLHLVFLLLYLETEFTSCCRQDVLNYFQHAPQHLSRSVQLINERAALGNVNKRGKSVLVRPQDIVQQLLC